MSDEVLALVDDIITEARNLARVEDVGALRITLRHLKRFVAGHKDYGALNIDADPRNFLNEIRAELDDALFYIEAQQIKEERQCARSNRSAMLNRTSYIVTADASLYTPEPVTPASLPSQTPSNEKSSPT